MADETKELLIKISATTELLRSQLATAERSVTRFEKQTGSSVRTVDGHIAKLNKGFGVAKAAVAGFAGGLAVGLFDNLAGGLLNAANTALEMGSSLSEASQQIGVTVEDLQRLRFAAQQSGISQDEIDAALKRLTRSMGDAARGAKGPTDALKALGFTTAEVRDLTSKTAGEVLPILADRLKGVENEATRASIGAQLFGKNFQTLNPLLAGGAEGVRKLTDEYRKLGIEISSEQAAKLDEAADAIAKLKVQLQGRITIFLAEHTDEIREIGDALGYVTEKGLKYLAIMSKIGKGEFKLDFSRLDNAAAYLLFDDKVRDPFGNDRAPTSTRRAPPRQTRPTPLRPVDQRFQKDFLKQSGGAPAGLIGSGLLAGLADLDLAALVQDLPKGTAATAAAFQKIGDAAEDALPSLEKFKAVLDDLDIDPFADTETSISRAFGAGGSQLKEIEDRITRQRDMRLEEIEAAYDRERQLGEETFQTLSSIYSDLFTRGTGSLWDNFRRIGTSVISDVMARFTLGLLSGKGAGPLGGILNQSLESLGFGGLLPGGKFQLKLPGFANGGTPPVGKLSVVGERGPELFVPRIPGTIIPNHALGGGTMRVEIVDTTGLFVTRVEEVATPIAAGVGRAAVIGGAGLARQQAMRAANRRLGR